MSNKSNSAISYALVKNYLSSLINRFFKILPIRESEEESLPTYIISLQEELLGFRELVEFIKSDPSYVTLVSILQFFIDNPSCSVTDVKREVFKAIHIIKNLQKEYCNAIDATNTDDTEACK